MYIRLFCLRNFHSYSSLLSNLELFISYLRKLCLIFYLRMFCFLVTLVFFQLYLLTMSSTHNLSTVFVNHVFFTTQLTNKQTFRCKAISNWKSNKIKVPGNTAKWLEWNSLLQNYRRIFRTKELETNYPCSQNCMQQSKAN